MQAAEGEGRLSLLLPDEAATVRLAEDVAAVLQPGDLVALSGGLGAGKTTFARALLRALASDPALEVPSPTFPIRIDHAFSRLKVAHADLYRLTNAEALDEIGLDEAIAEGAVLVEWPELLPAGFADNRLDVRLELAGEGRRAETRGAGTWPDRLARTRAIRAFLDRSGCSGATRVPMIGDASIRAYERISLTADDSENTNLPHAEVPAEGGPRSTRRGVSGASWSLLRGRPDFVGPAPQDEGGGSAIGLSPGPAASVGTAILMNAPTRREGPPIYGGRSYDAVAHRALDVRTFVAIDGALRSAGIRVPEIQAADIPGGLVLLEDLGNEGILDGSGRPILDRYEAAIDLLVVMHGRTWPEEIPLPDGTSYRMPPYDREALLVEISLFPDWFGGRGGEPPFPTEGRGAFLAAWSKVLERIESAAKTWVMRDFHSPNILWQAAATSTDRVGLLDFQDALIGHPAYDVASLAQDARTPISEEQEHELKARYVAGRRAQDPAFDVAEFDAAYAILGAQRATKVLGIFTRLALVDGKSGYQRHRARLKALIRRNLAHPVLSALRVWYEPYL